MMMLNRGKYVEYRKTQQEGKIYEKRQEYA